jgi:hypothetical protein
MKKLITFGDSFTYGEELADRTSAWPQQLANKLNYQLLNYGERGTCNDSMLRKLVEFLSDPIESENVSLVVIAWSNPGRKEYADESGVYTIWPGARSDRFMLCQPWRAKMVDYINEYHNSEWFCKNYLINVIAAQGILKERNIPYLMLDIAYNQYYKNLHLTPLAPISALVDSSNYIGWGRSGMAEWVGKVKRGPRGHFLEEGHQIVANTIYKYYANNKNN